MLQAWISSPRGSLYFAAEATPYNLEHLRAHVRALRAVGGNQTCLALDLAAKDGDEAVAEVALLARQLTREGIQVRYSATAAEEPERFAVEEAPGPSAGGRREAQRAAT